MDMYVAFDSPSLTLQRHGDALLVEVFMNAEVDQDILKWLNWCRMYLQVTTVADICTADGKYIRRAVWEGRRERLWQQRYQWPRTVRPANCHWDTWRDVLTSPPPMPLRLRRAAPYALRLQENERAPPARVEGCATVRPKAHATSCPCFSGRINSAEQMAQSQFLVG